MSSIARWLGGSTAIAVLGSGIASAGTGAPALVIDWSVNGGAVNHVLLDCTPAGGDAFDCEGTLIDPATGLVLEYNLAPDPFSSLAGNVRIFNALKEDITVSVDVTLPFVPDLPSGTQLSGLVAIGLTTGPGGGQISSVPPALFRTLIDGASAGFGTTLFWDPFMMGSDGQGNLSTHSEYGIPFPIPGPPLLDSLGYALNFQLTSLDLGSIKAQLIATGETTFCAGDLNGDGEVGNDDFIALREAWGPCVNPQDCPADLDGDGEVGVIDLLMLLIAWGPCS